MVAHPFATMLVPLGFLARRLGELALLRARDAYLAEFAEIAPHGELVATLELACRVAKVARVLTWERAVRAAWKEGETVQDAWTLATIQTLGAVADESYLSLG